MEFAGLTLDAFQEEACGFVEDGDSLVVSAPTGTGKTLIAEFAIDFYACQNRRSVYTAPIKALSNQKYMDFCRMFGNDRVGILTGDVSINPHALIQVMTTEVFRNMALSDPESISDVGLLILDEVHFMNDPERGTVWEESIIFAPPHIRFLALSATIPNTREFADWIHSIHDHPVKTIEHHQRAVPLYHYAFLGGNKVHPYDKLEEYVRNEFYRTGHNPRGRSGRKGPKRKPPPHHLDLVRLMNSRDQLPCLFFVFSRKKCELKAKDAAFRLKLLPPSDRKPVDDIIDRYLKRSEIAGMESIRLLQDVMRRGVAFHHAGMLPPAKRAVEEAFGQNLIRVLYATETFAVGINYPARTVAFSDLVKYDGVSERYLNAKEYFQMAGRAGRRGIDKMGRAIALIDPWRDDIREIMRFTEKDDIPITSRFQLSYNTVLNLLNSHDRNEIGVILEKSFDSFLKKKAGTRINVWASFNNRVNTLRRLGHLEGDRLKAKGKFTSRIYTRELVTAELFFGKRWKQWNPVDMACMGAAVIYEGKRAYRFVRPRRRDRFFRLVETINDSKYIMRNLNIQGLNNIIPSVETWMAGGRFKDVMEHSNLDEGDIIRIFRQTIDLFEQVIRATEDPELEDKVEEVLRMMDRGAVAVDFE